MGQRHQVYMFVKDSEGKVQGGCIHHQWLYGRSAALKVIEVMAYAKKAIKNHEYHPFTGKHFHSSRLSNCLLALYQLDMKTGDFNGSASRMNYKPDDTAEQECVTNPNMEDNNDGITVFDFTNPKSLAYCMVNIGDKADDEKDTSVRQLVPWTPSTIGEYVRAYYPKKEQAKAKGETKAEFDLIFRKTEQLMCMGQDDLERLFPAVFSKLGQATR